METKNSTDNPPLDAALEKATRHEDVGQEEGTKLEEGPSPDDPNARKKSKDEATIADIDLAALR